MSVHRRATPRVPGWAPRCPAPHPTPPHPPTRRSSSGWSSPPPPPTHPPTHLPPPTHPPTTHQCTRRSSSGWSSPPSSAPTTKPSTKSRLARCALALLPACGCLCVWGGGRGRGCARVAALAPPNPAPPSLPPLQLLAGASSKNLPSMRNLAMELRKLCCHPVSAARARTRRPPSARARPPTSACALPRPAPLHSLTRLTNPTPSHPARLSHPLHTSTHPPTSPPF